MRVCIPIKIPPQGGGGFRFIENLRLYLTAQGIEHTEALDEPCDVLFLSAWHVTPHQVMRAWRRSPEARLVHRIDGAAQDKGRADLFRTDAIMRRANRLTDRTIFQSAYSRYSTREKLPLISQDGPVIWNPVDSKLFTPDGSRRELPGAMKVCYSSFSTNPMKGAPLLYEVAAAHADIDFILCGHYDSAPDLPNLHLMGHLGREALAEVMRSCDLFLIFERNAACPNVLLEAMASGLPVLYLDSGALPELVRRAGLPVTPDTFKAQLNQLLANRDLYSTQARNYALTDFRPDAVFARYVEVMREALGASPRVPIARRRLLAVSGLVTEPPTHLWNLTRPFRRRVAGKVRSMWG